MQLPGSLSQNLHLANKLLEQAPVIPIIVYRFALVQCVDPCAVFLARTMMANLQPSSGGEISAELDEIALAGSGKLSLKQLHKLFHRKNQKLTWRMPFG